MSLLEHCKKSDRSTPETRIDIFVGVMGSLMLPIGDVARSAGRIIGAGTEMET